jgi:hypothetical protein
VIRCGRELNSFTGHLRLPNTPSISYFCDHAHQDVASGSRSPWDGSSSSSSSVSALWQFKKSPSVPTLALLDSGTPSYHTCRCRPSNLRGRCWITVQYPRAQLCLEYMLEWTSAFFSFILYVSVLLRVRGNLIQETNGKWSLRWVSRSESWQLAFARDYLDSCTVKMAAIIVW